MEYCVTYFIEFSKIEVAEIYCKGGPVEFVVALWTYFRSTILHLFIQEEECEAHRNVLQVYLSPSFF